MGLTHVSIEVANPARPRRTREVRFLVDSGALFSVVSREVLEELGIKPIATEEFELADGEVIRRRKGIAQYRYLNRTGGADVVFGEPGDSTLLGATTLEALGLALDPLRRELKPMRLPLMPSRSGSTHQKRR